MKVRFFLRSKVVERSEVMLVIRQGTAGVNLQELRIHTGLAVNPKHWNTTANGRNRKDRQRANSTDAVANNAILDRIEASVRSLVDAARFHDKPTLNYIKENIYTSGVLQTRFSTTRQDAQLAAKAKENSVIHYFEKFIEERSKSAEHKTGTVKVYKVVYGHLAKFLGSKQHAFKFTDIDKPWFESWKSYLSGTHKLTNNTLERQIKVLKTVLNWCDTEGYCDYSKLKKILDTRGLTREAETISLSQKEVAAIECLDLTENERLSRVRDLFLIAVYTGMRYSDLSTLKPEHIHDGRIEKRSVKTKRTLSIVLRPKCKDILERYGEGLPIISEQRLNSYIKELCALAGLDQQRTEVGRYRGTEYISATALRSNLVSIHTGRRTLITLSLDAGHLPRDVMKVTGQKDYKTLAKYDRPAGDAMERTQLRKWWDERGSV